MEDVTDELLGAFIKVVEGVLQLGMIRSICSFVISANIKS